jgi:hypothetical protein
MLTMYAIIYPNAKGFISSPNLHDYKSKKMQDRDIMDDGTFAVDRYSELSEADTGVPQLYRRRSRRGCKRRRAGRKRRRVRMKKTFQKAATVVKKVAKKAAPVVKKIAKKAFKVVKRLQTVARKVVKAAVPDVGAVGAKSRCKK